MPRRRDSAALVDGRMGEGAPLQQHAPSCTCPEHGGTRTVVTDIWATAARSSIPYCAACGNLVDEAHRGRPCDDCAAGDVVPTASVPRPQRSTAEQQRLVSASLQAQSKRAAVPVRSRTGAMAAAPLGVEGFTPEPVRDAQSALAHVESALAAVEESLGELGAEASAEAILCRAAADAYAAAGGGVEGRKAASSVLQAVGLFTPAMMETVKRMAEAA